MKKILTIAAVLVLMLGTVSAQTSLNIVRGDGEWAPLEWEESGEFHGLHMDLVKEAAERAGISITIQSFPWARSVSLFETGEADAITYFSKNPEREAYAVFDDRNILSSVDLSIITKKGSGVSWSGNLSDLQGKKVGILRGFTYGDAYEASKDLLTLDTSPNMESAVRKLEAGRIDAVLVNVNDFIKNMKNSQYFNQVEIREPYFDVNSQYIAFNKNSVSPSTIVKFANAMEEIKNSPLYNELLEKHGIR